MTFLVILAGLLLCAALCMLSFVQILYLESIRLRTRDLPSLQYFKSTLEARLRFEDEDGTLSFSLLKQGTLLLLAIYMFDVFQGFASWQLCVESIFTALLIMVVAGYVIPQMLYRRSNGTILGPLVPVLRVLTLLIRPVVGLLHFLHSLATS